MIRVEDPALAALRERSRKVQRLAVRAQLAILAIAAMALVAVAPSFVCNVALGLLHGIPGASASSSVAVGAQGPSASSSLAAGAQETAR